MVGLLSIRLIRYGCLELSEVGGESYWELVSFPVCVILSLGTFSANVFLCLPWLVPLLSLRISTYNKSNLIASAYSASRTVCVFCGSKSVCFFWMLIA